MPRASSRRPRRWPTTRTGCSNGSSSSRPPAPAPRPRCWRTSRGWSRGFAWPGSRWARPMRAQRPPVRPKRGTVLFEALLLGLFVGCGLAYLRDWMDQRLASAEEIQAQLGLGVLGVLPHMTGNETAAVRGQKVELDPMSDVAEGYRT